MTNINWHITFCLFWGYALCGGITVSKLCLLPSIFLSADETKIFAEQELGGGLEEGEDDDLFLLDAKIDNTQTADRNRQIDLEDNSDLFK